jgi:hypothetical protein
VSDNLRHCVSKDRGLRVGKGMGVISTPAGQLHSEPSPTAVHSQHIVLLHKVCWFVPCTHAVPAGESKPKHAFLLECLVDKWRTTQLPLNMVRPFMWDTLSLGAVQPPLDPEDTAAITAVLERKVNLA